MAEGEIDMKKDIHPKFNEAKVVCACGNEFVIGSVEKEIHVETCSECHPFYSGKQKFVSADGRVERFKKKYGM
jgi:large subunit ribosomal protein L31